MIKIVKVIQGNRTIEALEYALYAFRTPKGIYTLIGTSNDWLDTFKCLETGQYHEWNRRQIKSWLDNGLIEPVKEAINLEWYK